MKTKGKDKNSAEEELWNAHYSHDDLMLFSFITSFSSTLFVLFSFTDSGFSKQQNKLKLKSLSHTESNLLHSRIWFAFYRYLRRSHNESYFNVVKLNQKPKPCFEYDERGNPIKTAYNMKKNKNRRKFCLIEKWWISL